jgi:flagellar biosynthesis protein FlhF
VPGLRRLQGCDVVLIDTAGRGAHASGDHQTLREQLRIASPHETHLVLPAGLHPSRARRALAESRGQGITHLLITKLDEFPEERHLFGLAREFAVPARWVTDGQEVPRDLHRAERWWREGDVGSLGRIAREGLVTA